MCNVADRIIAHRMTAQTAVYPWVLFCVAYRNGNRFRFDTGLKKLYPIILWHVSDGVGSQKNSIPFEKRYGWRKYLENTEIRQIMAIDCDTAEQARLFFFATSPTHPEVRRSYRISGCFFLRSDYRSDFRFVGTCDTICLQKTQSVLCSH